MIRKVNGFDFVEITDNDPFDYCPIKNGIGPSSPVMPKLGKNSSLNIIEIDSFYPEYIKSKKQVRQQWGEAMFYQTHQDLPESHISYATDQLANFILKRSNNKNFMYQDNLDLSPKERFDSLCMQIQEDVVLMTMIKDKPTASIIHLHNPNGWSADGEIGKDFDSIHAEVVHRNNNPVVPHGNKMIANIIKRSCELERIGAISFRANAILNRHPDISLTPELTNFNSEDPKLYMRFERQTIVTLPQIDSFLFTIKTYIYNVFQPGRESHMIEVFKNIHTDAYSRWWLDENAATVVSCLESRLKKQ